MHASKTSSSGSAELLYDADCGVCKFLVARILDWDRAARLHPVELQSARAVELLPGLSNEERMRSFHLVEPDGTVHSAGDGLARLADYLPGLPRALGRGYWLVAGNRDKLGKLVPAKAKRQAERKIRARQKGSDPLGNGL